MTPSDAPDHFSRRATASQRRRQQILDAALECFAGRGFAATTMADIRKLAGASTGSIYHHFKSKEQLAAQLYLEGVRGTQAQGLQALMRSETTEQGIRALVGAYLDYVRAEPKLSAFLFAMRHADFMEPVEGELSRMNRTALETAAEWFRARITGGELPEIAPDVFRAILYGPAAHFARRLVAGQAETDFEQAKRDLADAAWYSLHHLLERRRPGGRLDHDS
ncbi:MAG: TetR/AcrR family transcriptional regulator [Myxococcales bacterium]|nr:TetR/AcrR family transcriptional regulator [Myxococcales bacterium]